MAEVERHILNRLSEQYDSLPCRMRKTKHMQAYHLEMQARLASDEAVQVIFFNGGTGISRRDRTFDVLAGKLEKTRIDHLQQVDKPVYIFQGHRDPFGKPGEVDGYNLSTEVTVNWLESGDHDFKPLKRSGLSQQDLISTAVEQVVELIQGLVGPTANR